MNKASLYRGYYLFVGVCLAATFHLITTEFVAAATHNVLLVEAEQFADLGGWDVDQQSMDQMGSPYVLAHGLGVPVRDAVTRVTFPQAGEYRVWVRTRDWVAPWKAPGAPGKFQLVIDGKPLDTVFGTEGAEWHWQDGGTIQVNQQATLALHDLTGFEGRCDAIVFTQDADFLPPNAEPNMGEFRRKQLGVQGPPDDGGSFDLVVVGGGIAGTAAAVSAARNGLNVALIQDRPVLGGNGSSEVRVWPEGHTRQQPFPRIGEIVEEICPQRPRPGNLNAKDKPLYDDDRKLHVVKAEPRITLMLEHRVNAVETRNQQIVSVTAQNTRTARRVQIQGRFFADCTGDGTVGYLAGADYEVSSEGNMGASNLWNVLDQANRDEVLKCECKDKDALTVLTEAGKLEAPFPRLPWALDLSKKPFPGRGNTQSDSKAPPLDQLGGWFWESGFDKDPINDIERIRDLNMRAMYGAWDTLKNIEKRYPHHRLGWSAFIAGKRESRRLLGDVVLSGKDFHAGKEWPDPAWPNSWHIDIHTPHPSFSKGLQGDEFISTFTRGKEYQYKGPYWGPYRCLYSRNIGNLFMAGRDISVTREALGAVRVMRTCGMMGETVGKAAWICVRYNTTPSGVYEEHLSVLKELMTQPGAMRRETLDGPLMLPAGANIPEVGMNGIDPAKLTGIVIDDEAARLVGKWTSGDGLKGFVGQSYRYSNDPAAKAKFVFSVTRAGKYEVRVAWQPHGNRAKSAQVTVASVAGEQTVAVDQTKPTLGEQGFEKIGTYEFDETKNFSVMFDVEQANGLVHIDAVQIVPVD